MSVHDIKQGKDQVWFKLQGFPSYVFGACYIAPADSPSFDFNSFSMIHEQCSKNPNVIIVGDLNVRIPTLDVFASDRGHYSQNPDTRINHHGEILTELCMELSLQPVNHYQSDHAQCDGGLTYTQGVTWVSQLDWAICSSDNMHLVHSFVIIRDCDLPTDHAPLLLILEPPEPSSLRLLERACLLGTDPDRTHSNGRRPFKPGHIDTDRFITNLPDATQVIGSLHDPNAAQYLSDVIYDAAVRSKIPHASVAHDNRVRNSNERWQKLVSLKDPKLIWRIFWHSYWLGRYPLR